MWEGEPMFPLLQVRISELPYVPEQLRHLSLLVLFHNLRRHPFDLPYGEGWLIREYETYPHFPCDVRDKSGRLCLFAEAMGAGAG